MCKIVLSIVMLLFSNTWLSAQHDTLASVIMSGQQPSPQLVSMVHQEAMQVRNEIQQLNFKIEQMNNRIRDQERMLASAIEQENRHPGGTASMLVIQQKRTIQSSYELQNVYIMRRNQLQQTLGEIEQVLSAVP